MKWGFRMHFFRCISLSLVAAALSFGTIQSGEPLPDLLIGYTEFRTDLPGGRYVNGRTMRAVVVKADGTGRRVLAEELTREKGSWTQFVGWSPDGKTARLSRNWKSEENGKWEEEHKDLPLRTGDGFRHDAYLFDLASGKATKQTPVDDKNKSELIKNLVHGRSISPDGKRGAFEDPAYRLFLADADGSNAKQSQDGPAVPPHALVVAGRRVGALRGRRALRLSPARHQGRRHRPEEAGQPQRLPRRHRLPRRVRLPRRQQRLAGVGARQQVRLLHRQGGEQRRAVPRHARRQERTADRHAGRVDALPPGGLRPTASGCCTARSATASASST